MRSVALWTNCWRYSVAGPGWSCHTWWNQVTSLWPTSRKPREFSRSLAERTTHNDIRGSCAVGKPPLAIDRFHWRDVDTGAPLAAKPRSGAVPALAGGVGEVPPAVFPAGQRRY